MAVAGTFEIRVGGRPLSMKASKDAELAIDERVRFIDKDVKRETRTFPPYQVLFVWTGVPKKLEEAQRILGYLNASLIRFFRAWAFRIEIHLEEKKGP